MTEKLLTRPEAAAHLNSLGFPITKNTLQKMATLGGGPEYQLFGNKALYRPSKLIAWAEAKLSVPRTSTSEMA